MIRIEKIKYKVSHHPTLANCILACILYYVSFKIWQILAFKKLISNKFLQDLDRAKLSCLISQTALLVKLDSQISVHFLEIFFLKIVSEISFVADNSDAIIIFPFIIGVFVTLHASIVPAESCHTGFFFNSLDFCNNSKSTVSPIADGLQSILIRMVDEDEEPIHVLIELLTNLFMKRMFACAVPQFNHAVLL